MGGEVLVGPTGDSPRGVRVAVCANKWQHEAQRAQCDHHPTLPCAAVTTVTGTYVCVFRRTGLSMMQQQKQMRASTVRMTMRDTKPPAVTV
jgi:hypothetical protein